MTVGAASAAAERQMTPNTALLIIDVQVNQFDPPYAVAGGAALLDRLRGLIERARAARVPVVFVRNNGTPPDPDVHGMPGWELQPGFAPAGEESVLDKTTNDTFESTDVDAQLRAHGVTRLVIAGVQSDFCIRATTLGALARGYTVTLASDGHSTCDGKTQTGAEAAAEVNAQLAPRVTLARSDEIAFAG